MTIGFDFEPDRKAGNCPTCYNHADIFCTRDRVFHCRVCNWSGMEMLYNIPKADQERIKAWSR